LNEDEARIVDALGLKSLAMIIPNGIFVEEIEPLPAAGMFTLRHPRLKGRQFILFMARLHEKKGLDYLAKSFALLARSRPSVDLVIVGPDEGARAGFEQAIASAGLTDRVHIIGALYGVDRIAALVDAACFCLPSRQEGFSIAILEALACGTPTIISEACFFPDVGHMGAGEIVPLEPPLIAAALARVLSDPDRARQMSDAGRRLVRSTYTWPMVAERSIQVYRAIASTAPQHS
jgi:glycosyltransferase involved in cell wall biosynthesis